MCTRTTPWANVTVFKKKSLVNKFLKFNLSQTPMTRIFKLIVFFLHIRYRLIIWESRQESENRVCFDVSNGVRLSSILSNVWFLMKTTFIWMALSWFSRGRHYCRKIPPQQPVKIWHKKHTVRFYIHWQFFCHNSSNLKEYSLSEEYSLAFSTEINRIKRSMENEHWNIQESTKSLNRGGIGGKQYNYIYQTRKITIIWQQRSGDQYEENQKQEGI